MENIMKHTKGEWYVVDYAGFLTIQDGPMYSDNNILDCDSVDEAEANAKLIAAAPDLLEFAIEMARRYPNSPWICEQANKAIKKATE